MRTRTAALRVPTWGRGTGALLALGLAALVACGGCAAKRPANPPPDSLAPPAAGEPLTSGQLDEVTRAFADRYVGLLSSACNVVKKDNPDAGPAPAGAGTAGELFREHLRYREQPRSLYPHARPRRRHHPGEPGVDRRRPRRRGLPRPRRSARPRAAPRSRGSLGHGGQNAQAGAARSARLPVPRAGGGTTPTWSSRISSGSPNSP